MARKITLPTRPHGRAPAMGSPAPGHAVELAEAMLAQGHTDEARLRLERVIQAQPLAATAHRLLVIIALGQGRAADGIALALRALGHVPLDAQMHLVLGRAFKAAGHVEQAVASYRRALELDPQIAEAHVSLGIALKAAGDLEAAIACYRRALAINPQLGVAHANLGNALVAQEELRSREAFDNLPSESALAAQARAVAADPDNPELHRNQGAVLMRARRHLDAAHAFNRALTLDPGDAASCVSLALCLSALGDDALASQASLTFLQRNPGDASVMRMLSEVLTRMGAIDEALAWADKAQALDPQPVVLLQMGNALLQARRQVEALQRCREAVDAAGRPPEMYAVFAMGANYQHEDPAAIRAIHDEFGHIAGALARPRPLPRRLAAGERLRVGLVSGDFVRHSVAFFIEALLEHHDRSRFEIVCYHNNARSDAVTEQLRAHADRWVDCYGTTDEQLRRQVQADAIDVLVDLSGHTANSRLLLFATHAAPLQLAYLGYPTTTGLVAIDHRVTDAQIDPGDVPVGTGEAPLHLPRTMFCYTPPKQAPEPGSPPLLRQGVATFGSFNNFAKITDHTLELWCAVLRRVPGSRLLLKAAAATQASNRGELERFFASRDVDPARLLLHDRLADDRSHLALYGQIDVALDTFPYNGATTTCEALWMGVPVVTRRGHTHTSRMGASILRGVARADWIADSDEQFIDIAAELAREPHGLAHWRQCARERLVHSELLDARGFARDFERIVLQAWDGLARRTGSIVASAPSTAAG